MNTRDILWETEGDQITPEAAIDLLYKNALIDCFLIPANKHFIVAGKGLGKTLILKTKRFMLEQHSGTTPTDDRHIYPSSVFVPSDTPYLDTIDAHPTLDHTKLQSLSNHAFASKLWSFAMQLSAITVSSVRTKRQLPAELLTGLPTWFTRYIDARTELTPCSVLDLLLANSLSVINQTLDRYSADVSICYSQIHTAIYFFIDKVDQAFLDCDESIWRTMQTGLMEAAWNCMRANHHVKIYAAIRVEAYRHYESPNLQAMSGEVVELKYDRRELGSILDKLSQYYESTGFAQFIGFSEFVNPVSGRRERVVDYIYRHTTGTPRNMVCIASKLNLEKERLSGLTIEQFREAVNSASHDVIGRTTVAENVLFLHSLRERGEHKRFFSLIHRNILCKDEVQEICRAFNGITHNGSVLDLSDSEMGTNDDECQDCSTCTRSHPFCELGNIGLVGHVREVEGIRRQCFVEPHQLGGSLTFHVRNSEVYLIHPSLYRYVETFRNDDGQPFTIAKFTTVCNGAEWGRINDQGQRAL